MRPTNLLFLLVSFTFLCSALSVKEWKKFENGKVKIHKKQEIRRNLQDIPNGQFKKGEQHFLHGHHLARLKNKQEKMNEAENKVKKDGRYNLEKPHSSEHNTIPNKVNIPKESPEIHNAKNNDKMDQKSLKAKQNKLNRIEKFQFGKKSETIPALKEKKYTKQDGKKKLGMTKMDGNNTAKKIWKHIVRDQVKTEGRFQIPKGNIPPPITSE